MLLPLVIAVVIIAAVIWFVLAWRRRQSFANQSGPQRDDRALSKLKPFFRAEFVEAKIKSLFPNENPEDILRLLDDLPGVWGPERLQLAILKLSNRDLSSLRTYVAAARQDYVSVIGQAEYPGALEIGLERYVRLPNPEQEAIHRKDVRQYLRWAQVR
ncbi:MAG TPA: hypothetical protein VEM96_00805 [Pyrinomonadaceae bacterium]|nr:hypothetical protein [Pyrinomonadaceae bacterium]